MTRSEFVMATTAVLFVAFVLGWFASWVVHRLSRVSQADLGEIERMAQQMHEAEEARDQAIDYIQEREAEMNSQLHQTEAELRAAMDGLRDARMEAEEMRAHLQRAERRA